MKVKCDYCGQMIDDSAGSCPMCGGSLNLSNRVANGQPKTIEELKKWYTDHNLPPEKVTRFFIGSDIKEPKAFGIYKDENGDVVVYKNKANGERAVRYQGKDEAYGVNELYQRLKSEIADQKERNAAKRSAGRKQPPQKKITLKDILLTIIALPFVSPVFTAIILVIALFIVAALDNTPAGGYYKYGGNDYYYQGSSWYSYDPGSDSWDRAVNEEELDSVITFDSMLDYSIGQDDHEGTDFEDTDWYYSGSYSSDDDDDYDWDSGSSWDSSSSWDSGSSWDYSSSDWDSDW